MGLIKDEPGSGSHVKMTAPSPPPAEPGYKWVKRSWGWIKVKIEEPKPKPKPEVKETSKVIIKETRTIRIATRKKRVRPRKKKKKPAKPKKPASKVEKIEQQIAQKLGATPSSTSEELSLKSDVIGRHDTVTEAKNELAALAYQAATTGKVDYHELAKVAAKLGQAGAAEGAKLASQASTAAKTAYEQAKQELEKEYRSLPPDIRLAQNQLAAKVAIENVALQRAAKRVEETAKEALEEKVQEVRQAQHKYSVSFTYRELAKQAGAVAAVQKEYEELKKKKEELERLGERLKKSKEAVESLAAKLEKERERVLSQIGAAVLVKDYDTARRLVEEFNRKVQMLEAMSSSLNHAIDVYNKQIEEFKQKLEDLQKRYGEATSGLMKMLNEALRVSIKNWAEAASALANLNAYKKELEKYLKQAQEELKRIAEAKREKLTLEAIRTSLQKAGITDEKLVKELAEKAKGGKLQITIKTLPVTETAQVGQEAPVSALGNAIVDVWVREAAKSVPEKDFELMKKARRIREKAHDVAAKKITSMTPTTTPLVGWAKLLEAVTTMQKGVEESNKYAEKVSPKYWKYVGTTFLAGLAEPFYKLAVEPVTTLLGSPRYTHVTIKEGEGLSTPAMAYATGRALGSLALGYLMGKAISEVAPRIPGMRRLGKWISEKSEEWLTKFVKEKMGGFSNVEHYGDYDLLLEEYKLVPKKFHRYQIVKIGKDYYMYPEEGAPIRLSEDEVEEIFKISTKSSEPTRGIRMEMEGVLVKKGVKPVKIRGILEAEATQKPLAYYTSEEGSFAPEEPFQYYYEKSLQVGVKGTTIPVKKAFSFISPTKMTTSVEGPLGTEFRTYPAMRVFKAYEIVGEPVDIHGTSLPSSKLVKQTLRATIGGLEKKGVQDLRIFEDLLADIEKGTFKYWFRALEAAPPSEPLGVQAGGAKAAKEFLEKLMAEVGEKATPPPPPPPSEAAKAASKAATTFSGGVPIAVQMPLTTTLTETITVPTVLTYPSVSLTSGLGELLGTTLGILAPTLSKTPLEGKAAELEIKLPKIKGFKMKELEKLGIKLHMHKIKIPKLGKLTLEGLEELQLRIPSLKLYVPPKLKELTWTGSKISPLFDLKVSPITLTRPKTDLLTKTTPSVGSVELPALKNLETTNVDLSTEELTTTQLTSDQTSTQTLQQVTVEEVQIKNEGMPAPGLLSPTDYPYPRLPRIPTQQQVIRIRRRKKAKLKPVKQLEALIL